MLICRAILEIIEYVVVTFIRIVDTIVETVCGWVSSIITTVVEVVKKVCEKLPWPLSKLCGWVTDLVEVVTVIWDWVCEEVIRRVIRWIAVLVTYIVYVLRWVCWVVDWPLRFVDVFACLIGAKPTRFVHVCVKILTGKDGTPATDTARVGRLLERASELLEQCNIKICVDSLEYLEKQELLTGVSCGASQLFSEAFSWFERKACDNFPGATTVPLTIYFVDSMDGTATACAVPNTSYVIMTDESNGTCIVHELGHQADLLHRDDPDNIMFGTTTTTRHKLTTWQCCILRSSIFVSQIRSCGRPVVLAAAEPIRVASGSHAGAPGAPLDPTSKWDPS